MQGIAFLACPELNDSLVAEIFDEPFQNFSSQALPCHFASRKKMVAFTLSPSSRKRTT